MLTATAALLLSVAVGATDPSGIAWLEDDWEGARKQALREGKLVAIDTWAAWCHTCLAMQGYVFTKPELTELRDTHVWLKLDFDNPKNAAFFRKHPVNIWPTFFVMDARKGTVVRRWIGAGTLEEMVGFFGKESRIAADAELAMKKTELLWKTEGEACAREGAQHLDALKDTVQGLDAIVRVTSCAAELSDEAERQKLLSRVQARLQRAVSDPSLPLTPDDRSSYFTALIATHDLLGQADQATEAVKKHVAMLELAAGKASTSLQRSTYVWPMVESYLRLGRFADAEKVLMQAEKGEAKSFNHTFWLALVYAKQGKIEPGLQAIDRALSMGYGARMLRLYSTKLDLLLQKGDLKAADRVVKEARAHLKKIPRHLIVASWQEEFEHRVRELEAAR